MAYSHTTWSQLKTQLLSRLGDASGTFWTDTECGLYLTEALRTFGLLTAFWRQRASFTPQLNTAFYPLNTQSTGSPTLQSLLDFTVTDRDLIRLIQYHLLESVTSQSIWPGTEMFTLDQLRYSIQRRRDQFLSDTGLLLTRSIINVSGPPIGRETLDDSIIDVRRVAWIDAVEGYYQTMWREDERTLTLADSNWNVNPSTPIAYSILAPPPLTLQLAPPPISSGQLELITVNSGPSLDPANSATILGIPDDLTPAIKWGALSDLLSIDGPSRDPSRAQFAEQRYQQYVQLTRLLSLVVHSELNGVSTIPDTLFSLDAAVENWQNQTGPPSCLILCGWNLAALYPVPDSSINYSVTLDVIQKAPIPTLNSDFIQLGREQLDSILDYATHLALFKISGPEFTSSQQQADQFLKQCITYNQRLSASARYIITPKESSQRQKDYHPRRSQSESIGTAPSIEQPQSFIAGNAPARLNLPKG